MKKGGAFIASGADTCVYYPQVKCTVPPDIPQGDYVSRITNRDSPEFANQQEVKAALLRIQQKYPGKGIETHFNLAVATCTPHFEKSDMTEKCTAEGQKDDKINFITPKQDEDIGVSKRPKDVTLVQLRKLYHAVAYLNDEGILHGDITEGNVSWMGNRLVLHDWGRILIQLGDIKRALKEKYFDRTHLKELFPECTIVLAADPTDDALLRFKKFYDIVDMTAELDLVPKENVGGFIRKLNAVWSGPIPTDKLLPEIQSAIEMLFQQRAGKRKLKQTQRFRKCIKKVRKTRKRTLRKVRCRHRMLHTQPMKGGVFLGMGGDAVVLGAAGPGDWDFLPAMDQRETRGNSAVTEVKAALARWEAEWDAMDIVAHVTDARSYVKESNDYVKAIAYSNPYVKMVTNAAIFSYRPDGDDVVRKAGREKLIEGRLDADNRLDMCLVMVRYTRDLEPNPNVRTNATPSILADIMIGLVHINGDFVHGDLHVGGIGLMRDGCPILTDYGHLIRSRDMSEFLKSKLDSEGNEYYWAFPQFKYLKELLASIMPNITPDDIPRICRIFDLLSVMALIEELLPELKEQADGFRQWLLANWRTPEFTQERLHGAVSVLCQRIASRPGHPWKILTMEQEKDMATKYNELAEPTRKKDRLWGRMRDFYRYGIRY